MALRSRLAFIFVASLVGCGAFLPSLDDLPPLAGDASGGEDGSSDGNGNADAMTAMDGGADASLIDPCASVEDGGDAGAVVFGHLYIVGGFTNLPDASSGVDVAASKAVWRATLYCNGAFPVSEVPVGVLPRVAFSPAAAIVGDHLVVMGGSDELGALESSAYAAKIAGDGTLGSFVPTPLQRLSVRWNAKAAV